jgi:glutathione synthase/RimK-type ligase-like ATP-grasp enzyme
VEHVLPKEVEEMCLKAARLCHHTLSGLDLKHRGGLDYVLLEANSAPVYLDIELKTGAPISKTIVECLERQASASQRKK